MNSDIYNKKINYDITLTDFNINKDFVTYLTDNVKSEMYYNYSAIYDECEYKDFNPNITIKNKRIIILNTHNLLFYYIILEVIEAPMLINNDKYDISIVYYISKKNVVMQTYKGEMYYDCIVRVAIFCDNMDLKKSDIKKHIKYKNIDTSK